MPRLVLRRPGFNNDGPEFKTTLPGLECHRPELETARNAFGPAEQVREHSKSGAKDTTTQKDTDAAPLYENILTIQTAADLEWPATAPANAGVRAEFRLGIFPPDHGGNHAPAPVPTLATAAPAK